MKNKIIVVFLFVILFIFSSCSDINNENIENNYNRDTNYKSLINSYTKAVENPDYIINDCEGGVSIVAYVGDDTDIVIPDSLDGKPVISLDGIYDKTFDEYYSAIGFCEFDSVTLPSTLKSYNIGNFHNSWAENTFKAIYVDKNNPYYSSKDGILFNKDKTKLFVIPPNHESKIINIPEGTVIAQDIVSDDTVTLNIPASLEKIEINGDYSAWYYDSDIVTPYKLTEINVSKNNKYFSSKDGVLYNKDMTELMIYPINKPGESFKVPDSVEKIDYFLLTDITYLSTITFGKNIKTIEAVTDFDYDVIYGKKPKPLIVNGYRNAAAEKWYKEQFPDWTEEKFLIFNELD